MWKKALALTVALCFLTSPAMARSWRGQHGHRHEGHNQRVYWHHDRGHHGYPYPVRLRADHDVFLWIGLTALGLGALNALTVAQRVRYQEAHRRAIAAPVGRTIRWGDSRASGTLTPVREGFTDDGEYCREFQREVRIDGRSERAWGIACLQEDGAWRVTR